MNGAFQRWAGFIGLTFVCLIFIHLFYGHILWSPNSFLFSAGGDGIKNYYTYAWHVTHDTHPLHFGGSGHPYGDHIFFADAHPALSWILRAVHVADDHVFGVFNLFLLSSLLITCWSLYALFRHFDLHQWQAAVGAFSIMLLQPQLFRLGGHLSLVHAWFVPLGWFLTLRSVERPSFIWPLLATLVSLFAYHTHPYLGLMLGFFQGVFLLFHFMRDMSSLKRNISYYLKAVVMVVLPVMVFFILMNSSDIIQDRPVKPQGLDEFHTRWSSLILPTHAYLSLIEIDLDHIEEPPWETVAYMGLPSIILLPIALILALVRSVRKRSVRWLMDNATLSLAASVVVLLFAFGVHNYVMGPSAMLDQFRATGRFAWVFWYAGAVFVIVRVHQYVTRHLAGRHWAAMVFLLVALIYAAEGFDQHWKASNYYGHFPNTFVEEQAPQELMDLVTLARSGGYAGLIPLPLPIIGSEYYERDLSDKLLRTALPLAYLSGLPIMAGITSRTSLSQTRSLLALIAPPSHPKMLGASFPPEARFLLIWSGDSLDQDEQHLLERAQPLAQNELGSIYRIDAKELFKGDDGSMEQFRSLVAAGRSQAPDRMYYDPISEHKNVIAPDRIIEGNSKDVTTILEFPPNTLYDRPYELSFIFEFTDPAALITSLVMEDHDPGPLNNQWQEWTTMARSQMQYKDRAIINFPIQPADTTKWIKFFLIGSNESLGEFKVTDILLRPRGVDVWREGTWFDAPNLFRNNIPITFSDRAYEEL